MNLKDFIIIAFWVINKILFILSVYCIHLYIKIGMNDGIYLILSAYFYLFYKGVKEESKKMN